MRRLALGLIVLTFLTACGPAAQSPGGNPTPTPGTDLSGRFVEVPTNQPFRYSVVAAGVLQISGSLAVQALPNVGPSYNNLIVFTPVTSANRFTIRYNGYAPPDQNSNLIVKAIAQGVNQDDGPYVVFLRGFNAAGIELGVHDLGANGAPDLSDRVNVTVEISQYVRTN